MPSYVPPEPTLEEIRENLRKDGGRKVMHGGNPYEDDLEAEGADTTWEDQANWKNWANETGGVPQHRSKP